MAEYSDYTDVFSTDLAIELLENISINKYAIDLIKRKQPLYGSIYTFSLVELETLKAYINTHLKTRFIRPSKSPLSASILFDKKLDDNLYLRIDY